MRLYALYYSHFFKISCFLNKRTSKIKGNFLLLIKTLLPRSCGLSEAEWTAAEQRYYSHFGLFDQ